MSKSRSGEKLVYDCKTDYQHYQVIELVYEGRPARVLYSLNGLGRTAQSGLALDSRPELLFDYNQRLVEIAEATLPDHLLLIGGGGYTLPAALLSRMPSLHIDVIELDAALEAIGRKYFDLPKTSRLRVITADGRKYIEQAVAVYDMIIIDAFSDADIPRTLSTLEAMQHIRHHLVPNGLLAVNLIASYYGQHTQALRQYYAAFTEVFERVQLFAADRSLPLLMPQNFVLIGSKNSRLQLDPFVRYGALQPPRFEPEDILHDEL